MLCRGDFYYADLSPVVGCEQGGVRPVLIVQNNVGNRYSPTVIVAAVTSRMEKHPLPTHVFINRNSVLQKDSIIMLEQIRTIDIWSGNNIAATGPLDACPHINIWDVD